MSAHTGSSTDLNCCSTDGATLIRYDSEKGKGDSKHVGINQEPYEFKDLDSLLDDFWRDVDGILEKNHHG